MPVLNTSGSAAYGRVVVAIDGATPPLLAGIPADTARWLTAGIVAFQNNTGPDALISQYNVGTPAVTTLTTGGLTRMGAGGGIWAAFLAGGALQGVRSNLPGFSQDVSAATGDVSEAGLVVLNTSYGTGRGIRLYDAGGVLRFADDSILLTPYNDPIPCRSGLVMYSTQIGWVLRTAPAGNIVPSHYRQGISFAVPVQLANGDIWMLERTDTLILRQKDADVGYQVNATLSGDTFTPDAREISPGVVRVVWCTNAGETAESLQAIDLTLATGANRTATVGGGTLNWTTQSPLTPVHVVTSSAVLKKWVGWFYSSGRYGDYRPKQNCTVLALNNFADGDGTLPSNAGQRMLDAAIAAGAIFCSGQQADMDVMKARWDLVAGLTTGEGSPSDLETQAALFRSNLALNGLPSKPIIATLTPTQLFDPGWRPPHGVDAYQVEVYFDPPGSGSYSAQYAATTARIAQIVAVANGVPVFLIAQAFDRSGGFTDITAITAIIDACGDALKADQ